MYRLVGFSVDLMVTVLHFQRGWEYRHGWNMAFFIGHRSSQRLMVFYIRKWKDFVF